MCNTLKLSFGNCLQLSLLVGVREIFVFSFENRQQINK